MKPILILQHLSADGPGFFGTWLQRQGVAFEVRNTQAGDTYPNDLRAHAAMAILGGEMSANDPLPSLRQAEDLIRQAVAAAKPVIGHCLGGQLMARALGARVTASPAPEVGWQAIDAVPVEAARWWFGDAQRHTVFQWHFDAFDLPAGAERLARSAACPNQAFAIGPHLGLQFHLEIDADKIARWSQDDGERWRQARQQHTSVQDAAAMRAGVAAELGAHRALADRVYRRWLQGVGKA